MRSHGGGNGTEQPDNSELPFFGGIIIVFAGNYLQLLPIMPSRKVIELPNGEKSVVPVCLLDVLPWRSSLWERVKIFRITQQIRQAEDTVFSTLLKQTATGRLSENCPLPLKSTGHMLQSYRFLWRWVDSGNKLHLDLDGILVCSTNRLVNEHNSRALEMFPGTELTFRSSTSIEKIRNVQSSQEHPAEIISPELTYNYAPTGVPPHLLKLKIGVPVMVIRNVLHPHLVNGKMFIVKKFTRKVLVITTNLDDGITLAEMLHRIDFQFDFSDLKVTRRQFPVKLAFSATVHKAQGQRLKKLFVDIRCNFFAAGQLYVALSRTRKSSDVLLLHSEETTPVDSEIIHDMPVVVANPILPQAVDFVEGRTNS